MRDEQTTHVASSREHVYTVGPGGGESGDLPVASVADDMKLKMPIPKTQKGNGKKLKTPNETWKLHPEKMEPRNEPLLS